MNPINDQPDRSAQDWKRCAAGKAISAQRCDDAALEMQHHDPELAAALRRAANKYRAGARLDLVRAESACS